MGKRRLRFQFEKVSCDRLPRKQTVTREQILCLDGKEGRFGGLSFQGEWLALLAAANLHCGTKYSQGMRWPPLLGPFEHEEG